jgi:Na+-transporting NADH:ubiquinone oxidoreductase subunit NqrF
MCGPGMMSQPVNEVLASLGVDPSSIHYDNFG